MSEYHRLLELAGVAKGPTIADATERSGNINRTTSDRIIDPRGYFAKNKRKIHKVHEDGVRRYLQVVEKAKPYGTVTT